ncbi:MAG: AraC family transcriptional regulator [Lachnospiraceae bacterium]
MMYFAGYHSEDQNFIDETGTVTVHACGHSKPLRRERSETKRENGRADYQILYVYNGVAYFKGEKGYQKVDAGNIYIYRPHEMQDYYFDKKDQADIYWIHINAIRGASHLQDFDLLEEPVISVGISYEYTEVFEKIILELQNKKECYEQLAEAYLTVLLGMMNRGRINMNLEQDKCFTNSISGSIHYINQIFSQKISFHEEAENWGMSFRQYERQFKKITGKTPQQYLIDLRIKKAKEYLKNLHYSIADVGTYVGYQDAFYFSRIFKKTTGMTPSDYRKQLLEKINP